MPVIKMPRQINKWRKVSKQDAIGLLSSWGPSLFLSVDWVKDPDGNQLIEFLKKLDSSAISKLKHNPIVKQWRRVARIRSKDLIFDNTSHLDLDRAVFYYWPYLPDQWLLLVANHYENAWKEGTTWNAKIYLIKEEK